MARWQNLPEVLVDDQIRGVGRAEPDGYLQSVGQVFIFIATMKLVRHRAEAVSGIGPDFATAAS